MSWAKVKKINSNLEVPLDELIIGQKRYVASDVPLLLLLSGTPAKTKSTTYVTAATFYAKLGGTLKIKCTLKNASADYLSKLEITDSTGVSILTAATGVGGTASVEKTITVSPNETYYMRIQTSNKSYTASIQDVVVGGDIVDYNWISGEAYAGDIS